MKTLLRIAIVGIALMLFSEATLAVSIRGPRSCGSWIEDRDMERRGAGMNTGTSWLIGFLSGLAMATGKEFWGKPNVNLLDNGSVYLWMDNYCRANPLKDIDDGGIELFIERTKGK